MIELIFWICVFNYNYHKCKVKLSKNIKVINKYPGEAKWLGLSGQCVPSNDE